MQKLVPGVQHYSWGSATELPKLLGVEPDGTPWAELWVGDHPRLPSTVAATGQELSANLPFLLKILAADKPLSIQSHPSSTQAVAGFQRENELGISLDAPDRTYRDPNHKPELICALSPFEALCGFRRPSDLVSDFGAIPALAEVSARLASGTTDQDSLASTVQWLLTLPPGEAAELVDAVGQAMPLTRRLGRLFSGDPGAVVALLLNHVTLQPGQAMFLGAGVVHGYLEGMGVELMANSDNVIRGGLTPKHIDVPELLRTVDFRPSAPAIQTASGPRYRFESVGSGFWLTRIQLGEEQRFSPVGPELVLVTEGELVITSGVGSERSDLLVAAGDAVFLDQADGSYRISGSGVAWQATVGH